VTNAVTIAVIVVLFFVSGVMALAETAFTRSSRIKMRALAEDGDKRAERLLSLFEEPERTLNSVLLIVLVSQMTSATLLGSLLEGWGGWVGFVLGTVAEVFVFFTFAEVAPKTYAVKHPERAALALSPLLVGMARFKPLRVFVRGFIGLANVVLPGRALAKGPFVTEAEILAMVDVAADEETIEDEQKELIHSVLEIGDTPVSDVMVPRTQMTAVEANATVDDAVKVMIDSGFSRVPTYENSTDNISGLVYLKDLVARSAAGEGSATVQSLLREAVYVPESKKVDELLRAMQARKFHMAVVVDEYGGTAGIVTMEDLLEEIVGEIVDEFDAPSEEIEELADGRWRVPGRTPIGDMEEELGTDLDGDWDTVGGLVFNTLGHLPAQGDAVEVAGHQFVAERVDGRRIVSVVIRRLSRPDAPDSGATPASPSAASEPAAGDDGARAGLHDAGTQHAGER
jgi:CBS domain containing-hemolysin-like protein